MASISMISPTLRQAIANPSSPYTEKLFQQSFPGNEDLIRHNQLAARGRRIAVFLANLDSGGKTAFESYGRYLNLMGHLLHAAILQKNPQEAQGAESYIASVNQAALRVFVQVKKEPIPLNKIDVTYSLNEIDVPKNQFGQAIPLASSQELEKMTQDHAEFFAHFKTEIVRRKDMPGPNGTSLRGVGDMDVWEKQIPLLKKMLADSQLLEPNNLEKVIWMKEALCNMLEGKEINDYVRKAAEKQLISPEMVAKLQSQVGKSVQEATIDIIFSEVLERMENFKRENPTIQFSPKDLLFYFVQDFYSIDAGLKFVVDPTPINAAREQVLKPIRDLDGKTVVLGAAPIQFPRIAAARLDHAPLNPLTLATNNFFHYMNAAVARFPNEFLSVGFSLIERQVKINEIMQATDQTISQLCEQNLKELAS